MYKVCYWDAEAQEQKERDATQDEVAQIEARKAAAITECKNSIILLQISDLELKITPRRMREALLTGDTSYIASIEAQIAALRAQLV